MAPPTLTATLRYYPPGTRKFYWMPTSANYNAPTRAELNAGVDLSPEVAEVAGWGVTSNSIEVPDLSGRFVPKIPAQIVADDSTLTIYASSTSNDVRSVLPRDTSGFIVVLPEGDITGQKMDVFPVKVAATAFDQTITDPGRIIITFSITKVPAQNATIP